MLSQHAVLQCAAFAFQHAEITPWWQLAGVAVIVLVAGVPALAMSWLFERFNALRDGPEVEAAGQDNILWGLATTEVPTPATSLTGVQLDGEHDPQRSPANLS
jgi:hypothetical protein